MPWRLFEELYKAHAKRKSIESAEATRNAMIGGLWANSNFDDDKGTRDKAIRDINQSFYDTITSIYNGDAEEIDLKEDPFFAAMKLPDIPGEMSVPTTTTDSVIDVDQGNPGG